MLGLLGCGFGVFKVSDWELLQESRCCTLASSVPEADWVSVENTWLETENVPLMQQSNEALSSWSHFIWTSLEVVRVDQERDFARETDSKTSLMVWYNATTADSLNLSLTSSKIKNVVIASAAVWKDWAGTRGQVRAAIKVMLAFLSAFSRWGWFRLRLRVHASFLVWTLSMELLSLRSKGQDLRRSGIRKVFVSRIGEAIMQSNGTEVLNFTTGKGST